MQLGLTIPLQRQLRIKNLSYGAPLDRRLCWDLHIITLRGRKSLLAVHASSRYTFTLYDMSFADWDDVSACFLRGLQHSLKAAGISENIFEHYLQMAKKAEWTKTHGRREVAFLNRAWDDVMALDYTIDSSQQTQMLLDCAVNQIPCRCAGHEGVQPSIQRLILDCIQYRNGVL